MEDTNSTGLNSNFSYCFNRNTQKTMLNQMNFNENREKTGFSFMSNASLINLTNMSITDDPTQRLYESLLLNGKWSNEEENLLLKLKSTTKKLSWIQISSFFKDKNPNQCMYKYKKLISSASTSSLSYENHINQVNSNDYLSNQENFLYSAKGNSNKISYLQKNNSTSALNKKEDKSNESQFKSKDNISQSKNIDLLKKFFPNKLINDLQVKIKSTTTSQSQTQPEKKRNRKSSFTPTEDQILINLYINPYNEINESDLNSIKSKNKEEAKRRVKLLLKLKGEEASNIDCLDKYFEKYTSLQRFDSTNSELNTDFNTNSDGNTYKSSSLICKKRSLCDFAYGCDSDYSQVKEIDYIDNIDNINENEYVFNLNPTQLSYGNLYENGVFSINTIENISNNLNLNLNEADDCLFFSKKEDYSQHSQII